MNDMNFMNAVDPGGKRKNDPGHYVAHHGVADFLERAGYSIILPVGGAQAGKTTLLMSVLRHLDSDPASGYAHELTDVFHYPVGHPIRQATDDWYYHEQLRSENFCILDATAFVFGKVMFIPILITPVNGGTPMKLAFVESMGGAAFPGNPDGVVPVELADILENFAGSISFMYLAPSNSSDVNLSRSLLVMLNTYQEKRAGTPGAALDSHLWVATHWDKRVDLHGGVSNDAFYDPDTNVIEILADRHYSEPYQAFMQLPRRGAFPYCADVYSPNGRSIYGKFRPTLHCFAEDIMSWIARNYAEVALK